MSAFLRRLDVGAEMPEQQLGVVAAGLLLDHGSHTRRGERGQQHRRFDLGRSHGRAVGDRHGIAGAAQGHRQAAAFPGLVRPGAHQLQRIKDAPHWSAAQRGVAVEHRRDRAAGDGPHHQPAAGAGIAEIERILRFGKATHPNAIDLPRELAGPFDPRAQRLHRFGGIEDVLALEQAGNAGFADRKCAQDQRPVRDRLVAGDADFAGQGPAGAGFQRRG